MADYYVSDTDPGDSSGDSWANAAPLMSVVDSLVGAGDTVFVDKNHAESTAASRALDFSLSTTTLQVTLASQQIILRRCVMQAAFDVTTDLLNTTFSTPEGFIQLEACSDGTISTAELGLTAKLTARGLITSVTAVYRTGGADDGEQVNAYSWNMAASSIASEQFLALKSPPLVLWVDPDTTPSGATAQGIYTSTRMAVRGTPAALTTDSASTWNGSGVGTKQKITHTLSNQNGATLTVYVASGVTLNDDDFWIEVQEPDQVGGPVTVTCYLAIPSTTVYVDPKLEVA